MSSVQKKPELFDVVSLAIGLDVSAWQILACRKGSIEFSADGSIGRVRVLRTTPTKVLRRTTVSLPKVLLPIAARLVFRHTDTNLLTSFKNSDQFFDEFHAALDTPISPKLIRRERTYDSSCSTLIKELHTV